MWLLPRLIEMKTKECAIAVILYQHYQLLNIMITKQKIKLKNTKNLANLQHHGTKKQIWPHYKMYTSSHWADSVRETNLGQTL